MNRYIFIILLVGCVTFFGCDYFVADIPPEQLPPVPEECSAELGRLHNALLGAYTTGEVSQVQITRYETGLADCMKSSGLSRAEIKGLLKEQERKMQKEAEQGVKSGQGLYPF
jgi:hypothetical protein